ncbi:MAG TPA: hypothetical protein VK627_03120 [Edaphobacter sp.]|nr:hypothetical protein [Edaphobacter sp.]
MNKSPVILLEFNELCPSLMDQFIAQGHLPSFKKLRDSSAAFISEAKERPPYLEPWVQWINVHTGVPASEHGALHLSEGHKVTQPAIWDLVSEAGMGVWLCGSMNIHTRAAIKGSILPDPWSSDTAVQPAALQTYYDFVRRQVQEHSNASAKFGASDYLAFLSFMASHGLSRQTITTAIKQLRSERAEGKRWRRAFILELLQFDVFADTYRKQRPMFSTFFLNSTAHMQHVYWRNMQPELFSIKPSEKDQQQYSSAILEGYVHMDGILSRLLKVVGDDATIVFSTAISQQPFLHYEDTGGKRIYRPKDLAAFARWAGIKNVKECNPVMSEQFWLVFENESDMEAAATQLEAITLDGTPAFPAHKEGNAIFSGFSIRSQIDPEAKLISPTATSRFFDLLYEIEGLKSGMHHPEGLLWIRDARVPRPSPNQHVELESVAPTILELMNIEIPAHLKAPSLAQGSLVKA